MCVTLPFVCSWVFVFVQKENFQSFDNNLSRCHPFFCLCVCGYTSCVNLGPYVLFMMSHIPRQQPVNMSHLSDVISFVRWPIVFVTVCLVCNWVVVLVRKSHPLAAACQDVPSFVRWPIVCVMYVLCVSGSLC